MDRSGGRWVERPRMQKAKKGRRCEKTDSAIGRVFTRVETDLVLAQTLVRNLLANAPKFRERMGRAPDHFAMAGGEASSSARSIWPGKRARFGSVSTRRIQIPATRSGNFSRRAS